MNKVCSQCRLDKNISDFYKNIRKNGKIDIRSCCRACDRKSALERSKNPEYQTRRRERLRQYRNQNANIEKPMIGKITCNCCSIEKDITDYHKDKGVPNGRNTVCKKCVLLKRKQNYYQYHWDISSEIISAKMAQQKECCAICGKKAKLVLDHNHSTHTVRDFLCNHCNTAIGYFNENLGYMKKGIEYLERHKLEPSEIKAELSIAYRRRWETVKK